MRRFWSLLILAALLSSALSYLVDHLTFEVGLLRSPLTLGAPHLLLCAVCFNVCLAVLARLVAASTVEAEGSGFPEMKAMLFGKVILNYLSLRVLLVKLVSMTLGIAAGLPMGKDGPNVHISACVVRLLNRDFFDKYVSSGPHGAGSSDLGAVVSKWFLAACAMGFGCTFEAPIGGVIFALELMLPQSYDVVAYWGCFCASVVGAITYLLLQSNPFGHVRRFLPLVSSNVLPGEGDSTEFPVLELLTFILLGIFCGLAGGLFVRSHAFTVRISRRWRNSTRVPRLESAQEPLLRRRRSRLMRLPSFHGAHGGRDLLLVALLAVTNTLLASSLPLLGGLPQPLLISKMFDKNLMDNDTWILPRFGVLGTLLLCFMAKWTMTLWSLSAEIPAGVVAPTIVLGALLGRIYASLLPEWFLDLLLTDTTSSAVTTEAKGALLARFAIIGASAFTAGVCRTFAMAITVFELLTLPNSILPLCASALVAIFVANRVSLPFFDSTLAAENLGGIPALGFSTEALWPVMKVMEPIQLETDALPQVLTLRHLLKLVTEREVEVFPIIRPVDWTATNHQALLVGCMTQRQALRLLKALDPHGETPRREIDLMNPEFQAPSDGAVAPFVDGNPLRISPEHTVKDAYLLMKMSETGVIYVTNRGVLTGSITLGTLLCREL